MSGATAHVDIVAPAVPGATPGTVVGAAEILDRGNRRLGRVPLRADEYFPVEIPHGERCLVHGWSPYMSVQPVVVTGGHTRQVVLAARRTGGESTRDEEPLRNANGWVRLWGRESDGRWTMRDPSDMATGDAATVATPLGGPAVLQVGAGRQRPVCTLVPEGSSFTLRPAERRPQSQVEVRPVADSGFTLLEALRLAEWGWAAVVERVWWDDPDVRGTPLFDLAVAYLACRRGDLERVSRWRSETADRHETGPMWLDRLSVDAWLARRRGEWRFLAGVLGRLVDAGGIPLVAEGLELLAAELARPALESRAPGPDQALRRLLAPYLRASLPSALSSFTAAHPEEPEHRPQMRARPDESLSFQVEGSTSALRIQWRGLSGASTDDEDYTAVAQRPLPSRRPDLLAIEPEDLREQLIIEGEDPMVLWRLSHRLLDERVAIRISLVPGRDAVAVTLPSPPVGPAAALLTALLREGSVRRLGLSVGGAPQELGVADAAEVGRILADLLREGRRSSP